MKWYEFLELIASKKVIIIAGEYGRGKSLSATAILFFLFVYNGASKILSNIPLNFMIFNKIISVEPYNCTSVLDKDHIKTLIFHDELQRDFNTREFQSSSSNIFSRFAVNFRKDESQLVGTIQFMDRLDNALNEIVQIIIIPTYKNTYSKNEKLDLAERLLRKDFIVEFRVKDNKTNEIETVEPFNLYPFLFFYDTKFKSAFLYEA